MCDEDAFSNVYTINLLKIPLLTPSFIDKNYVVCFQKYVQVPIKQQNRTLEYFCCLGVPLLHFLKASNAFKLSTFCLFLQYLKHRDFGISTDSQKCSVRLGEYLEHSTRCILSIISITHMSAKENNVHGLLKTLATIESQNYRTIQGGKDF